MINFVTQTECNKSNCRVFVDILNDLVQLGGVIHGITKLQMLLDELSVGS